MYVIAMKNMKYERQAMQKLQRAGLFRSDMVPLVEVIKEDYEYDKLIDRETGEFVTRQQKCRDGKVRNYKVNDLNSKRDVTLRNISSLFDGRDVLVDYFRCDLSRYDYDSGEIELVLLLNGNIELYCEKVNAITSWPNLVPVITVKQAMPDVLAPDRVLCLIDEIRRKNEKQRIAIRIDDIDGYEQVLKQVLRKDDYLIYDFNEQPMRSKPMECLDLKNLKLPARLIALCSPRKRDLTGKDYPNGKFTNLIDNSHLDHYKEYGFDSVGDYGGLKDKLPTKGGSRGRALAVLYCGAENAFMTFVNDDVGLGAGGFPLVAESVLSHDAFRGDKTCLALGAISSKLCKGDKGFSFGEWVEYTLVRYIQQLAVTRSPFD